jgi:hypothetical protein
MNMKCRQCNVPWKYDWEYCPECKRNYGGAIYPAKQTDNKLREIDQLIEQIHLAFADVTLGDGESLHQAHLEGAYWDEAVWVAAKQKDPETHWREVPDWKIEYGASTLSFFDPEGWRFYIPALMCWTLRNWRTSDSITSDSILWNLALTEEYWARRYRLLDRDQCDAIYDFLAFFDRYSGEDDADKAIQAYWHQFGRA